MTSTLVDYLPKCYDYTATSGLSTSDLHLSHNPHKNLGGLKRGIHKKCHLIFMPPPHCKQTWTFVQPPKVRLPKELRLFI